MLTIFLVPSLRVSGWIFVSNGSLRPHGDLYMVIFDATHDVHV